MVNITYHIKFREPKVSVKSHNILFSFNFDIGMSVVIHPV